MIAAATVIAALQRRLMVRVYRYDAAARKRVQVAGGQWLDLRADLSAPATDAESKLVENDLTSRRTTSPRSGRAAVSRTSCDETAKCV